jgi:hypothetical protein
VPLGAQPVLPHLSVCGTGIRQVNTNRLKNLTAVCWMTNSDSIKIDLSPP